MRLMIVSDYLDAVSGAEISSINLVNALAREKEIEKIIWIGMHYNGTLPNVDEGKIELVPVRSGLLQGIRKNFELAEDLLVPRLLAKKIRAKARKADLIHAQHVRSAMAVQLAKTGLPDVVTVRDYWPVCGFRNRLLGMRECSECDPGACIREKIPNLIWPARRLAEYYLKKKSKLYRACFESCESLIWNSKALRNSIGKKHGCVIHTCFGSAAPEKNRKPDFPAIFFAGRLYPAKGLESLLEAMKIVAAKHEDARLFVFGSGDTGKMRSLAKELGIEKSTVFFGKIPHREILGYYQKASVVVLPSVWGEPFSRILVEAMSFGRPIVATNTGGTPEAIKHNKTGLLVEPKNPEETAKAINFLLENPSKARAIGEAARKFAQKNFSPKIIAGKHIECYKKIFSGQRESHSWKTSRPGGGIPYGNSRITANNS